MRRRQESEAVRERNSGVVAKMIGIKEEHPFWGYRRVWAYLRYVEGIEINKKRVLRLIRQHKLLVKPDRHLRSNRTPQRRKPQPDRPNEWWGIDMTKIMVEGFGWMYVVVVLDWWSKKLVGYYAGMQCTSKHWLEALDMGVNNQFPNGVRGHNLHLMSDNGCQPTSECFMRSCRELEIKQAFTSYNNPKGNADTERVIRTLKEELLWLREWTNVFQVADALGAWVKSYNENYLHSALGYRPPAKVEAEYFNNKNTLLLIP